MSFAIIETGGKQYKVSASNILKVEKLDIKKGNKVKIICGKDKNKEGEIIEIDRKNFRAKVKGLNLIKKHMKINSFI